MNKTAPLLALSLLTALAAPAWAAGNAQAGQVKAAACMLCHGSKDFPGMFYTLQLAGRNADKLTIKTNKYRSGKVEEASRRATQQVCSRPNNVRVVSLMRGAAPWAP